MVQGKALTKLSGGGRDVRETKWDLWKAHFSMEQAVENRQEREGRSVVRMEISKYIKDVVKNKTDSGWEGRKTKGRREERK